MAVTPPIILHIPPPPTPARGGRGGGGGTWAPPPLVARCIVAPPRPYAVLSCVGRRGKEQQCLLCVHQKMASSLAWSVGSVSLGGTRTMLPVYDSAQLLLTIKHFLHTKGGKLLKRCTRRGKYSHKMRSQTIVGIVSLVSLQIFKNSAKPIFF